jgi:ketosteroid isomerase-like protein
MQDFMRSYLALIVIGFIVATSSISGADRSGELRDLVNSEREFAQRAKADGMQAAFLNTLSDNAVVFRPLPVNGKLWYLERGETVAQLIWEPEFADVSASGDLGYTTGPWKFLPEGEGSEQIYFGHYLSIWRKTCDGGWMVEVDIGISHDGPFEAAELVTATKVGNKFDRDQAWKQLAELEAGIGESSGDELRELYLAHCDENIRFYRDGNVPVLGVGAASEQLADMPGEIKVNTLEVVVASSGDLGYAYGTQDVSSGSGSPKTEAYLRIWRNSGNGEWRIVTDFALPSK